MAQPFKSDTWFTSPWNFLPEVTKGWKFPRRVKIHDTTLRDGEQQAGVEFNKDDKIRIAAMLDDAGVDRIEAGMPAVSWADAEAIKHIAKMGLRAQVFSFSRCLPEDVKRAADTGVKGILMEVPSSEHLIQQAYKWPLERAVETTVKATLAAKEAGLYTVFFPIDASRAEMTWYLDLIERIAREGHMDAMVLVDTFGVLSPDAVQYFVRRTQERIKKPLETHFHMDFGVGVANTIVALMNGVETAHTTVTGMGERAGNVPMEDLVMCLKTLYGVETNIKTEKLFPVSKFVRKLARHPIPPNRHIVGEHLFDVESGIPVSWLKNLDKDHMTEMFPFLHHMVGHHRPRVVIGKGSGLDSMAIGLNRIGMTATTEEMQALLLEVKNYSLEKRRLLTQAEFRRLAEKVVPRKRPVPAAAKR